VTSFRPLPIKNYLLTQSYPAIAPGFLLMFGFPRKDTAAGLKALPGPRIHANESATPLIAGRFTDVLGARSVFDPNPTRRCSAQSGREPVAERKVDAIIYFEPGDTVAAVEGADLWATFFRAACPRRSRHAGGYGFLAHDRAGGSYLNSSISRTLFASVAVANGFASTDIPASR
jgi:hypothetical protein